MMAFNWLYDDIDSLVVFIEVSTFASYLEGTDFSLCWRHHYMVSIGVLCTL